MAEDDSGWGITATLWIVNVGYYSEWNESTWKSRELIETDDCGPANLISPGFVLWLVLAPAIACVVQLPGSVLFYGRSNLYRFAPEMGVADCLATLALLVKALRAGYTWTQSVLGIFLIREAIGEGDLWWRKPEEPEQELPQPYRYIETVVNHSDNRIRRRLKPYSTPISLERTIGILLLLTIFIKIIAILATATPTANTTLKVAALLALSYSASFLIFELLVWILAIGCLYSSVQDIPPKNIVDLVRSIDPGDNPFTFPTSVSDTPDPPDNGIELVTMEQEARLPGTRPQHRGCDRAVMLAFYFTGIAGVSIWAVILAHAWDNNRTYFSVLLAAVAVVCEIYSQAAQPEPVALILFTSY